MSKPYHTKQQLIGQTFAAKQFWDLISTLKVAVYDLREEGTEKQKELFLQDYENMLKHCREVYNSICNIIESASQEAIDNPYDDVEFPSDDSQLPNVDDILKNIMKKDEDNDS